MPLAPPADAAQTLEARLSRLSHAQLLRLVALGCNESTQVMAEASRMLVPLWAADRAAEEVFLSTDLLDCIMASLGAQDAAVASVCKLWAASWATLVARRRYVDTKPLRLQMSEPMFAMTTMPDGTLCFNLNLWDDTHTRSLRFMSSHSHPAQAVPPRLAQRVFGRVRSVRAAGDSVWVLCEDRRDHQIDCILRLRVSDGEEMASGFVGPDICEMKVADGLVFLAQDVERAQRWVLTARDANTLRPTHIFGSFDSPGLSAVPSCFAAADGKVFVVDGDRDVHVFEVPPAVPEKILLVGNSAARVFSLPARPNADFRCIADAAAQNGRLYVAEAFLKEVETDYEHVYGVVPDHDTVCIVDLACGCVLQEFQLTPSPHRVVDLNIDGNALQVLRIAHSDTEPTSELLTFKIHGEPPTLWAAVEAGDSSAVRRLLAAGADPTRGLPAAVNRGDTELVCTLLAAGADAQLVLPALGLADGRLAKLLFAIGADGAPVRPVAMEAWLQGGEEAVVRSLLAARADPTPALMAAVQGDEVEVVFNLLASVADGEAGLDHAAEQDESVARMLLEAGADADGFGLLEAAAEAGDAEAAQLLLEHGARRGAADALAAAVQAGAPGLVVVPMLLDAGAVPEDPDELVRFASQEGDAELLQRLLADLPQVAMDAQDAHGNTALHHAADGGELATCTLLLDAGARCDVPNHKGHTPQLLARRVGHTECAELLRSEGCVDDASGDCDSCASGDEYNDESEGESESESDGEPVSPWGPVSE
jgi:hypothetical protein